MLAVNLPPPALVIAMAVPGLGLLRNKLIVLAEPSTTLECTVILPVPDCYVVQVNVSMLTTSGFCSEEKTLIVSFETVIPAGVGLEIDLTSNWNVYVVLLVMVGAWKDIEAALPVLRVTSGPPICVQT